jgi:outer membrane protein assembly factor BamB
MLIEAREGGAARKLIVVGGKDGIRAWDRRTHHRIWHTQLTPSLPPNATEALPTSGPETGPTAAAHGLVFFASNNHQDKDCQIAALAAGTGEIRWLHTLPAFQFGPMSVAGGVVFLGLADGKLRAWRAKDGELLWESGPAQPIAAGPAVARGMVFIGTGAGNYIPGNKLLAFGLK